MTDTEHAIESLEYLLGLLKEGRFLVSSLERRTYASQMAGTVEVTGEKVLTISGFEIESSDHQPAPLLD